MQTTVRNRRNKHVVLDQKKLDRAKKILGASTETETLDIALSRVISEAEANRKAWSAHDKFVASMIKGGLEIEDVYGNLEED